MYWPLPKDPDDSIKLRFNWGAHRLAEGETITDSDFIVDKGGVVITEEAIDGGFTTFRVTGGTHGVVAQITNRVTTSAGNQYDWTGRLRVKSTS